MRYRAAVLTGLLALVPVLSAGAQNWGSAAGVVTEKDTGKPIPGVTVLVYGTDFGTATDDRGLFRLNLPAGRYALLFRAVGYASRTDSVRVVRGAATSMAVSLEAAIVQLDSLLIQAGRPSAEAGSYEVRPEDIHDIPDPMQDGLRVLKVLPGVASNNELSNQYSVRGGGYNENLIFIDGFEVHLPFRPRQGEQEGLSPINSDLARSITFYTGGFPARYGGKLSSALDVRYREVNSPFIKGAAYVSLLDAGASLGAGSRDGSFHWNLAVRKAQARRFFETQELEGNYQPDYTDLQGTIHYRFLPRHELDMIGMGARNLFRLDPRSRKTYFGTISLSSQAPSNLQSMWLTYDGDSREEDGYGAAFGGVRWTGRWTDRLRSEHDVSYFRTVETEMIDMAGSAVLYQVDPESGDPQSGSGHVPLGATRQTDRADNRVAVGALTGQGRWIAAFGRHALEAGWYGRLLGFDDRLDESSLVSGKSPEGLPLEIEVNRLNDTAALRARQGGLYVQNALDALPEANRLLVTGGIRADYFSFNREWTVSPRFSARYRWTEATSILASAGVYYQAPAYRELRGKPTPGQSILQALNGDVRSQRSRQIVAGIEHFLPGKRLYLRAEMYHKALSRLISYDVQNVRVQYSGRNDAEGYVYGLDLQVRGEFVPGLESWVNYSYMIARERYLPAYRTPEAPGWVPRPTDQRHTFSAFIQDYVPGDPTWKVHLRGLFGSGFPYTPPRAGARLGNLVIQEPGRRFSARFVEYMRMDLGVSKQIVAWRRAGRMPLRLQLTGEVLNIFDMTNTVAYSWLPAASGAWTRIPVRLTPRTINAGMRLEF